MPEQSDPSSIPDAVAAMAILTAWEPPAGLKVTVASTCEPDEPDTRYVTIALSAVAGRVFMVHVIGVPEEGAMAALDEIAGHILQHAWDDPACVGIGPDAETRPILDSSRFGRDQ